MKVKQGKNGQNIDVKSSKIGAEKVKRNAVASCQSDTEASAIAPKARRKNGVEICEGGAKARRKNGVEICEGGAKASCQSDTEASAIAPKARRKVDTKASECNTKARRKVDTKMLALMGIFVALIIVGAFIKIPTPLMPVTLQCAFCLLAGLLLGGGRGACCVVIYIVMGLIGIPVFTLGGGVFYVLQPSFGFLIGFIFGALVAGKLARITVKGSCKDAILGKKGSCKNAILGKKGIQKGDLPACSNGFEQGNCTKTTLNAAQKLIITANCAGKSFNYAQMSKKAAKFFQIFGAALAGLVVVYMIGLPYMYLMKNVYLGVPMGFDKVFIFGCALFLPTDILWCVLSSILTYKLLPKLEKPKFVTGEYVYIAHRNELECDETAADSLQNDEIIGENDAECLQNKVDTSETNENCCKTR